MQPSLGEQNEWAKYTNFEAGTRIPFLVHDPGQTRALRTAALVRPVSTLQGAFSHRYSTCLETRFPCDASHL